MRARNIKPGFFKNEQLAECSVEARLLFPGLWMLADRKGRLEYRPKRWKGELFPYDSFDTSALFEELERNGLVMKYEVDGVQYVWIPHFLDHQKPHQNESASTIPAHPSDHSNKDLVPRCEVLVSKEKSTPAESLFSDSLILDSLNPERESLRSQDAGARVDHSSSCLEKLNNSPADTPCAETVTTPVQAEVSNSQEKLTSSPAKQPPFSGPRQDAYSQEFLMLAEQYPRKDEGVAAAWIAFKALKNSGTYPGNTFVLPILVAWRASPQWMDDGGRYIPSFSKWIREKRWEAGPPEDPQEKLNRQLNDLAAMAEMKKAGVRQ